MTALPMMYCHTNNSCPADLRFSDFWASGRWVTGSVGPSFALAFSSATIPQEVMSDRSQHDAWQPLSAHGTLSANELAVGVRA